MRRIAFSVFTDILVIFELCDDCFIRDFISCFLVGSSIIFASTIDKIMDIMLEEITSIDTCMPCLDPIKNTARPTG